MSGIALATAPQVSSSRDRTATGLIFPLSQAAPRLTSAARELSSQVAPLPQAQRLNSVQRLATRSFVIYTWTSPQRLAPGRNSQVLGEGCWAEVDTILRGLELSQGQLAALLGVSRQALGAYRRASPRPRVRELLAALKDSAAAISQVSTDLPALWAYEKLPVIGQSFLHACASKNPTLVREATEAALLLAHRARAERNRLAELLR